MKYSIFLLMVLVAGCLPPGAGEDPPKPIPVDPPKPSGEVSAIELVLADYRAGLKVVFADVVEKIASQELTTERGVNQYVHDESNKVREKAFMILNREFSEFYFEQWSPRKSIEFWRIQEESL